MSNAGAPRIEVESAGIIDARDSAYPQATLLRNGDVLCSFSNAGGSSALGGTDWARSTDDGRTWAVEGTLLAPTVAPPTTNFLKLSRAPDRPTVYAYGARFDRTSVRFGERATEPVLCLSDDDGHTWSAPRVLPIPGKHLEITHGVLALRDGRLLAPAASIEPGRIGERVFAAVSTDGGETWPALVVLFADPYGERGFLEHKLTDLGGGHLLGTAWTIRMGDVVDLPNSYVVSHDSGESWSAPEPTDTVGQTLSTVDLGGGWILALYNRRHTDPGIVVAVVSFESDRWVTHDEALLFSPTSNLPRVGEPGGVDRFAGFEFGFPTGIRVADGAILATFWARDGDRCSVRWSRLQVAPGKHHRAVSSWV